MGQFAGWSWHGHRSAEPGITALVRIGETMSGGLLLAPHLYPLPRYSLRGGGEETIRQLLLRRSLNVR